MELFKNENWPEQLYEKLQATGRLEGAEALAHLALQFSNATNGNYDPEVLFKRVNFPDRHIVLTALPAEEVDTTR